MLAACELPAEPDLLSSSASARGVEHIHLRDARRVFSVETASQRLTRLDSATILIDLTYGPCRGVYGDLPDVVVSRGFMQVDEQAYWLQPWLTEPVIRVPRSRDARWIRDGFRCPGWLIGERDDLLYCAEETSDRQVEITAVDKSGFSSPAVVASLPKLLGGSLDLHMSVEHQGPLLIGERVLLAIDTGFVSAELEGDDSVEFIELGYRPQCVVARGERVAWIAAPGAEQTVYSASYPLSTIHHEYGQAPGLGLGRAYEPGLAFACPAWVGESLLLPVHRGETMGIVRLNEREKFVLVEGEALAMSKLVGDGDLAWWYVEGRGLWRFDATSHAQIDTRDIAAATLTADGGVLTWLNNAQGGCGVHVSDAYGGPVAWR
jgi:hypothetical protein